MMVVAGTLLAEMPTYHSPHSIDEDFTTWLRRHDLTRRDGYWLADRRDPVPLDTHTWKNYEKTGEPNSTIVSEDFDRVLFPASGMVTLWGYWTSAAHRLEEVCNLRSALVSPQQSSALLRALQSADDHHDYIIPDAEDDRQINFDAFQLKGWIVDRPHDTGIDGKDPWAGAISYPAPCPSKEVIEAFDLVADREHRAWRQGQAGPTVVTAEIWGTYREKDDHDVKNERGDRVQVSTEFLKDLLGRFGMDMIVEVEIERRRSYSRYESQHPDDIKPLPTSTRVYLVKVDGRFRTI
jgi:hypothetical protein